jgi:CCR4-NOT transcription complex subunit 1
MLRNIGLFLGEITLSMNKPLLDRHLNLKELLCYGYEHGLLIVVSSLVCKILEGTKSSKVFKLPNPWLLGVLGLIKELYELEDLKTNIKFEFQVLLKNIDLSFEQIPSTTCLLNKKLKVEKRSSNSDYNISKLTEKAGSMTLNDASANEVEKSQIPKIVIDAKITIPNIDNFVRFPGNFDMFFEKNANKSKVYRQYIIYAVDRAIIETVNNSSNINIPTIVLTVKSIVLNDFAVESNEKIVRAAAHSMVQSLVELFIPATVRECLKRSIYNYVGAYINHVSTSISTDDTGKINASNANIDYEEIISFVSLENVDIGLNFIIKMITDKTKKLSI